MEKDTTTAIQTFQHFATDRLNIHLAELNTRYENEAIDKDTLAKAYSEHQAIFSQELDEKISNLCSGQYDQSLNTELQNKKQDYLSQLNFKQSNK